MNKTYNILVTGCGGDIGQSIGKILKSDKFFKSVIGCDMNDEHAGKFIFDICEKIPACRAENYFEVLEGIVKKYAIDIILPVSEPELRFFTERKISSQISGKPLITANLKAMEIGFDKLKTAQFLKTENLIYPETTLISEVLQPKLPMILKDRTGSGSKALFLVKDFEEFEFYKKKYPGYILQQYLENANEEYTCGLFRDAKGNIRILNYKRKLMGGFSGYGLVVENKQIDDLLYQIAKKIDLRGSINVQLRLTEKGPMVFEINPRFSSTVMFRHMMGFKDVIWSIQDVLGSGIDNYTPPPAGKKFYKGFYEYID